MDVNLFTFWIYFYLQMGSLITITSFSFEMLLLGRAIQGIGAGGIFPVDNAFIGDILPPEKRGSASRNSQFCLGFIKRFRSSFRRTIINYSWQLLFIINLPIAAGVLIGSFYILPKSVRNRKIIFDWYG